MAPTRGNMRSLLGMSGIYGVLVKEDFKKHEVSFRVPLHLQVERARSALEECKPFGTVFTVKKARFWHRWKWVGYDYL